MHRSTKLAACWTVCLALVLGSLMPLLAAVAADLQGKPIAEVCEVYGVALPAPPDAGLADPHAHHHGHHPGADPVPASLLPQEGAGPSHSSHKHSADHCALTALVVYAGPVGHGPALPPAAPRDTPVTLHAIAHLPEFVRTGAQARAPPPAHLFAPRSRLV